MEILYQNFKFCVDKTSTIQSNQLRKKQGQEQNYSCREAARHHVFAALAANTEQDEQKKIHTLWEREKKLLALFQRGILFM